jgi:hypothetical protein
MHRSLRPGATHSLFSPLTNSVGPSPSPDVDGNAPMSTMLAPRIPRGCRSARSRPRCSRGLRVAMRVRPGPARRAISVHTNTRDTPTHRLGPTQYRMRVLARVQAHVLYLLHRLHIHGVRWRDRGGRGRDVCDHELLDRARRGKHGGHRDLATHRVSNELDAGQIVSVEEGEDVRGYGGVACAFIRAQ